MSIYAMVWRIGMVAGDMAMKVGSIMASEVTFSIEIHGRSGHASQPHYHIDSLPIAAQIILALQAIISRSVDPKERAVVSVTEVLTNGTVNVIPSVVTLKGDC